MAIYGKMTFLLFVFLLSNQKITSSRKQRNASRAVVYRFVDHAANLSLQIPLNVVRSPYRMHHVVRSPYRMHETKYI